MKREENRLKAAGDTGSEQSPETRGFRIIHGIGEAEYEALCTDAALRELVRLWSTLSDEAKQIIVSIVQR